jgi:mono/diheme cytochrome c family protein
MMPTVSIIRIGAMFCATLFPVFAVTVAGEGQTEIEGARPPDAPIASGEEMYRTYCAVCHALDGKGGGPATPALRDQVPDLTTLSQRHGGKYPAQYVESVLRFGTAKGFPAHGNKDMPIWARVFTSVPQTAESTVTGRITNLTQYLGTIQTK